MLSQVGQISLPKWASLSCQTQIASAVMAIIVMGMPWLYLSTNFGTGPLVGHSGFYLMINSFQGLWAVPIGASICFFILLFAIMNPTAYEKKRRLLSAIRFLLAMLAILQIVLYANYLASEMGYSFGNQLSGWMLIDGFAFGILLSESLIDLLTKASGSISGICALCKESIRHLYVPASMNESMLLQSHSDIAQVNICKRCGSLRHVTCAMKCPACGSFAFTLAFSKEDSVAVDS